MSSALKLALGFVLAFAAGFSAGVFLKSDPGAPTGPERRAVDVENQAASSSEDVLRRLLSIEALLREEVADRAADGPSQGEATRSETTDLHAYLEQRFDSLEEAVRSLGDLSEIKAEPDLDEIQRLQAVFTADKDKALSLIRGMSFREAIHQFGAPTFEKVHDKVRGPEGGYATHWLWETPSLGYGLAISFEEGVAYYAWFSSPGKAREYITTLDDE